MERDQVLTLVREHLAEELEVDAGRISETTRFREDLDADSLDLYTLVQELEDSYGVRISDEEAWNSIGETPIAEPSWGASQRRMRFYLWTRQRGVWPTLVAGAPPLTDPTPFDPWCPLRNVDAAWPPTLLLHGTADTDVPFEQSVLMEEALTAAGVNARLITLAGAPHVFDRGITLADLTASTGQLTPVARACQESIAFLAHHLGATG